MSRLPFVVVLVLLIVGCRDGVVGNPVDGSLSDASRPPGTDGNPLSYADGQAPPDAGPGDARPGDTSSLSDATPSSDAQSPLDTTAPSDGAAPPDTATPPDTAVDSSPPPDTAPAPDTTALTTAETLVSKAYCRVLSRPVEAPGLGFYGPLVTNGQLTVKELVRDLAKSTEYRADFVTGRSNAEIVEGLYDALFARASDPAGKAFNVGVLDNGADYTVIADSFVDSVEYANSFGDDLVPGDGRAGCQYSP